MKRFFEWLGFWWNAVLSLREWAADEREIEAECEEARAREGADGAAPARLGREAAA